MTKTQSSQLLDSFNTEIERQRASANSKASAILTQTETGAEPSLPTVSPRRYSLRTPEAIASHYEPAAVEAAAAVAEFIGRQEGAADVSGSMKLYRALCLQSDFIDRVRRADTLIHSSRARRKVHAAARRQSHGAVGGYFQRKVQGEVLNIISQVQ